MIIIGAGMAGLIAANYFRKRKPVIFEVQSKLPHNHTALLRFRTDKVFRIAGITPREVTVRKEIYFKGDFIIRPNPYLANLYSEKVTGRVEDRSIWRMEPEKRYIAPPDFVELLASGCDIKFGTPFNGLALNPTISTLPMPTLMASLDYKGDKPFFEARPIWTINVSLDKVDVNQTIYFPDLDLPYYRASIVGDQLIIELIRAPGDEMGGIIEEVIDCFGIHIDRVRSDAVSNRQAHGKISPVDEQLRKEFMHWATLEHGVYSLGRFATWKPILLDDVVDDLQVIEKIMNSRYAYLRHQAN